MQTDIRGGTDGRASSASRAAGTAVYILAVLYAIHAGFVYHVGPANQDAAETFWMFGVIAVVIFSLIVWSCRCVRRGGRLIGAFLISALLCGGGAIGAFLAANTMWDRHPWFVIEQATMSVWAFICIALLARAYGARVTARQRNPTFTGHPL